MTRMILIHPDPHDPKNKPYWFTEVIERDCPPPPKGSPVVITAADVAVGELGPRVAEKPWFWGVPGCKFDYEIKIEVPGLKNDPVEMQRWLERHHFLPHFRHEYPELFGVAELAVRFPPPTGP